MVSEVSLTPPVTYDTLYTGLPALKEALQPSYHVEVSSDPGRLLKVGGVEVGGVCYQSFAINQSGVECWEVMADKGKFFSTCMLTKNPAILVLLGSCVG